MSDPYVEMRSIAYMHLLEILIVVAIIGAVCTLIITKYRPFVKKADTIQITGDMNAPRVEMVGYYALHGEWPKGNREAASTPVFGGIEHVKSKALEEVIISDGAIHFTFGGRLEGKTLTLHAALPQGEPSGPVIWVAGKKSLTKGWSLQGKDRTNLEDRYIPRCLR